MKERCDHCKRKLNHQNCTMIASTCDDCLADEAADNRESEMACQDAVVLILNPKETPNG